MQNLILLLYECNPRSVFSSNTIIQTTETIAGQVVLQVSWIEMVRKIEDLKPKFGFVLTESSRKGDALQNLQVN